MIYSSMSIDDVMVYSNILFVIIMALTVVFCIIYVVLAKKGFYRHVDNWIATHYVSKPKDEKKEAPASSPATYLLFSSNDDKYDPLLNV